MTAGVNLQCSKFTAISKARDVASEQNRAYWLFSERERIPRKPQSFSGKDVREEFLQDLGL